MSQQPAALFTVCFECFVAEYCFRLDFEALPVDWQDGPALFRPAILQV
jgi:hypothetical protein